ncbi:bi-domain-containing oxidoreductase [bacterium]|nr:bi-domain-containing oxidoreductase [bacterium]
MKQAIINRGNISARDISAPNVNPGSVLIKVVNSCISAGTEINNVKGSKVDGLIRKALQQPERVAQVLNSVKSIGIQKTISKVQGIISGGGVTGYSLSGVVIGVGEGVDSFKPGDRVTAAGATIANHAEYVDVPKNLVCKMPKDLSFKEASTVTLGSIALQGVRRSDLKMGEFCVVTGAGILGLLCIQMLRASGVRVAAVDLDDARLKIAKKIGAEIAINLNDEKYVDTIQNWTGGVGADAVLLTAATESSKPLSQSFQCCRRKGKVVIVGAVGLDIKRADMYEKELDLLMSTSYGPGRYDSNYEEKGNDYPYAYVRWTENRNMSEYLRLLSRKDIILDDIIDSIFDINDVGDAFKKLQSDLKPLIVLLEYGEFDINQLKSYLNHDRKIIINDNIKIDKEVINVALIGSGAFATSVHMPNISSLSSKFKLIAVMNRSGNSARFVAEKYKASYVTTNYQDILSDKNIDMVLISTRHDSHANLSLEALKHGKHVFVEKPMAINQTETKKIADFYNSSSSKKPILFTGFNRRFSPYSSEIRKFTNKRISPLFITYRMNAGYAESSNWIHEDGGRIIGEGCHIIDLMTSFINEKIISISCESIDTNNSKFMSSDNKSIILKYKDGSIANIQYFASGSTDISKEYMEVHFDGKSIVMDNYKSLKGYGVKTNQITSSISDKGHKEQLLAFYSSIRGHSTSWPIDLWDMMQTTESTFIISEL